MIRRVEDGHKTKKNEVKECIQKYYIKYKGAGARKLHCKVFTGVTEREIQQYINSLPKAHRVNPKFSSKVPPKPVQSSGVLSQVQIDLVDMSNSPSRGTCDIPCKYILVVDVFSRFCFLHAVQTKSSTEVASRLIEIFSDVGPPLRIQSDQGSEFKGSVKELMQAMKVKIITADLIIHNPRERYITMT